MEPRTQLNAEDANGKYLFASDQMALSACYAIPNGKKHFCALLDDGSVILVVQRATLKTQGSLDADIYTLPEDKFLPHPFARAQFISREGVPVDQLSHVRSICSFDDLMDLGVQIFAPAPGIKNEFTAINPEIDDDAQSSIRRMLAEGTIVPVGRTSGNDLKPVYRSFTP